MRWLNVLVILGMLLSGVTPALAAERAQTIAPAVSSSVGGAGIIEQHAATGASQTQGKAPGAQGEEMDAPMEGPPSLEFMVRVTPEEAAPGDAVTFTITLHNYGVDAIEAIAVSGRLVNGVIFVPGSGSRGLFYDAKTRGIAWPLKSLQPGEWVSGRFRGRIGEQKTGSQLKQALTMVAGDSKFQAVTMVTVATPRGDKVRMTPETGGWLRSGDGRVELKMPVGAVTENVDIVYKANVEDVKPREGMRAPFSLNAVTERGKEVHVFDAPLTLYYYYTSEEMKSLDFSSRTFFVYDENSKAWELVPSFLNMEKGRLETELHHFSTYTEGSTGETFVSEESDRIRGVQPSLFTGSINSSYGFELPPGRGGLTPVLGLRYASANHSQDKGHYSYVGHGWTLTGADTIYIPPGDGNVDKKTLRLQGVTYSLKYEDGKWHAKENPFLKIETPGSTDSSWPGAWEIWTQDGVKYTFAGASGAEDRVHYWKLCGTGNQSKRFVRIPLRKIEDTLGNVIEYTWETETRSKYGCPNYTSAIRLKQIDYNGGMVHVVLSYVNRTDEPDGATTGDWKFFPTKKLRTVTVNVAGVGVVQQYHLENVEGNTYYPSQRALNLDWVASQYHTVQPRKTWFTYSSRNLTSPNSYGYLTQVKNAIGGKIDIVGQLDQAAYYVIHARKVYDGLSSTPATWTYQGYDWDANTDQDLAHGYARMEVTRPDGVVEKHYFRIIEDDGQGNDIDDFAGREKKVEVFDGGTELSKTETTWDSTTTSDLPFGGRFVFRKVEEAYRDGQGLARRTYQYQTWRQGEMQYGNLTERREYEWGGSSWNSEPYRTTYSWYYPNTSNWIVDKSGRQDVYKKRYGASGAAVTRQHFNYYDQRSSYSTAPTQGLLLRERVGVGSLWQTTDYDYWSHGNLYKVTDANGHATRTFYDGTMQAYPVCERNAKGHETKTRYYGLSGNGNATSGPDGASACATGNGSSVSVANGRIFGLPEEVKDANNAITSYRYDQWGRLLKVWLPGEDMAANHAPTQEYIYPPYSQSTAPIVIRQRQRDDADGGSSAASYLESWTVYDGLGQVIQTQTEAEVNGADGKRIVVDRGYDEMGRLAWESVPYAVNSPGGDVMVTPQAQPKTQYAYDGLGRVQVVTHPDGTTTSTSYSGRETTVIDAKNHKTVSESDGFGRLVRSQQFTGDGSNEHPYALYAKSTYAYDVLDNLTDVYGPDASGSPNVHTHINYDALGRKTGMTDPDMGVWSYGYDAAGNLIRQTDAKDQRVCFYYDELNRLRGKTYSAGTGDCPNDPGYSGYATRYYYDKDENNAPVTNGKGRRTVMIDGSGDTRWEYDSRGRVTEETKTIAGETFVTQWKYDAMDRVKRMRYPGGANGQGGEWVQHFYNDQGLLKELDGDQDYANDMTYTALGELSSLKYEPWSSVLTTLTYDYYDDPNESKNFRLQRISSSDGKFDREYFYDGVGNVTQIKDYKFVNVDAGQAWSTTTKTYTFGYDALNRLTSGVTSNYNDHGYDYSYDYAPNGNFTKYRGNTTLDFGAPDSGFCSDHPTAPPHALTHYNSEKYCYDENGNQIKRKLGNDTWDLTYDAENRLTEVKKNNSVVAQFWYDGDGNRVKAVVGGTTTYYVGKHYEYSTGSACSGSSCNTKYYFANGGLVSFRRTGYTANNGLRFVIRDHLNSTSLVLNGGGTALWADYFTPYGGWQHTWKKVTTVPLQTKYRYTGQRHEPDIKLYDYNARWYDNRRGRFTQPDTIVPNPGDPQSLNRYAYAGNNPVRYRDPSGHGYCVDEACDIIQHAHSNHISLRRNNGAAQRYAKTIYDVTIENGFSLREQSLLLESIMDVAGVFGSTKAFRLAMGGATMIRNSSAGTSTVGMKITFDSGHFNQQGSRVRIGTKIGTVHELAHEWSNKWTSCVFGECLGLDEIYTAFTASETEGPTAYGSLDPEISWASDRVAEHWAESVTMYVYPEYADVIRNDTLAPAWIHKRELSLNNGFGPGLTVNQAENMQLFFNIFSGE